MKKILLRGPILSRSGYGEQTRFAFRSLVSKLDKFDVYLDAIPWGKTGWIWEDNEERNFIDSLLVRTQHYIHQGGTFDASIQVTIPNEWEKLAPINIGYTAGIETSVISAEWLQKSSIVDRVIVVSDHARSGFEGAAYEIYNQETKQKQGDLTCTVPVDVVPYPVRKIKPASLDLQFETDFNFLVVAQWGPRKNLTNTIKWFVEEFHDNENVGLLLKIFKHGNSTMDAFYTQSQLNDLLHKYHDRKCKVYLLHGDMSEAEMAGLYVHPQVKSIINLAHGEGYGLPLFEAAYSGLPVVAPDWSGHKDFLYMPTKKGKKATRKSAMFAKVDYTIEPVKDDAVWKGVIEKHAKWCYAKKDNYKLVISDVYANYEKHKSKANKLKTYLVKNFEENHVYDQFVDSVNKCLNLDTQSDNNQQEIVIL